MRACWRTLKRIGFPMTTHHAPSSTAAQREAIGHRDASDATLPSWYLMASQVEPQISVESTNSAGAERTFGMPTCYRSCAAMRPGRPSATRRDCHGPPAGTAGQERLEARDLGVERARERASLRRSSAKPLCTSRAAPSRRMFTQPITCSRHSKRQRVVAEPPLRGGRVGLEAISPARAGARSGAGPTRADRTARATARARRPTSRGGSGAPGQT